MFHNFIMGFVVILNLFVPTWQSNQIVHFILLTRLSNFLLEWSKRVTSSTCENKNDGYECYPSQQTSWRHQTLNPSHNWLLWMAMINRYDYILWWWWHKMGMDNFGWLKNDGDRVSGRWSHFTTMPYVVIWYGY